MDQNNQIQQNFPNVAPVCGVHGSPMVWKNGGVSQKTGKPYNGFWSCPVRNEDGSYCNFKPVQQATPRPPIAPPQRPVVQNVATPTPAGSSESVAVFKRIETILGNILNLLERSQEDFVNQQLGVKPKDVEIPIIEDNI